MIVSLSRSFVAIWVLAAPVLAQNYPVNELPYYFPNVSSPQPIDISVGPKFINTTLAKVRQYRPSRNIFPTWTNEGPARPNISALADHWATEYDWFSTQKEINSNFSNYATSVPGSRNYTLPIPLHFVHERSSDADAIPLLLIHGWPSSFLEWQKVIAPLTVRTKNISFHVVAPDLPGFGFSPAPIQPGMGTREMGAAFDALMHQLGYDRYGVVSTDLGWWIGNWMASDAESSVLAHFFDFASLQPNATDLARFADNQTTVEENDYINSLTAWEALHDAYHQVHATKPLAVSLAMNDSPVGFAGWMWDLVYTISDGFQYTYDEIITSALSLFIPGIYANVRAYLVTFDPIIQSFPATSIPSGFTSWGWPNGPYPELANFAHVPLSWVQRRANVTYYAKHSSGGHFPAISEPELWLADVREFFLQVSAF